MPLVPSTGECVFHVNVVQRHYCPEIPADSWSSSLTGGQQGVPLLLLPFLMRRQGQKQGHLLHMLLGEMENKADIRRE